MKYATSEFPNKYIYKNMYEKTRTRYEWQRDEDGNLTYVEAGKIPWYEYIQSFKDSTDLKEIVKRVNATGDVTLLNQRSGQYIDATTLPDSLRGLSELSDKLEQQFKNYDDRFKSLFNGFEDYQAAVLSGDIQRRVKEYNDKIEKQLIKEDIK